MRRTTFGAIVAALGSIVVTLGAWALAGIAQAQTFPSKSMRIVVPFPPGGPTDQVGRMLAQKMQESTGQSVVVDNRPGGGGQIAAPQLMGAPPDGHTLLIGDMGVLAVNRTLYSSLNYDALRDFAPITLLMSSTMVMVVPTSSPATSAADFLARARAAGGKMSYASQGIGTGGHLAGEMLKTMARIDLVHVPYKGGAPAMQDLIAGQVDVFFEVMGASLPQSRGGKLRMLAVAAPQRSKFAPDVPTTAEIGLPELTMAPWFGIVARAGTPAPIIQRLHAEITRALAAPDVVKRLTDVGFDPIPNTPEQFAAHMRDETAKWGAVVKSSGARVD